MIVSDIMPSSLALIEQFKSLCRCLSSQCPGLAAIVYGIVSVFDIDSSKVRLSCTWIDKGLRNPYGVEHLLQVPL